MRYTLLLMTLLPACALMAETLQERAEQGDTAAMFELADHFFHGTSEYLQNPTLAAYWYRRAAENGDTSAMFNLGLCYEQGIGVEKDMETAYEWYSKAGDKGNLYGKFNAALIRLKGIPPNPEKKKKGLQPSPVSARYDIDRLVSQKFEPAMIYVAEALLEDRKNPESAAKVWLLLNELRDGENPRVLCMLADCCYEGIGTKPDQEEMLRLLRKAVKAGDAEAAGKLAHCYEFGRGVAIDQKKADNLYRIGAQRGNAMSQFKYAEKLILELEKLEEAVSWYRRAADAGNPQANFKLAVFHYEGLGSVIAKNEEEAGKRFFQAAEAGYAPAQYNIAIFFEEGRCGLRKDPAAATYWFLQAAEKGDAAAARYIGLRYLDGVTVTRSITKGTEWLVKAAQGGDSEAIRILRKRRLLSY